jgi:hypothetical protein
MHLFALSSLGTGWVGKFWRSTKRTRVLESFIIALSGIREPVAPCMFSAELARTIADHFIDRSLYLDLRVAHRGTRDNTWLVAHEFADWLTSTKDLSIEARFDTWYNDVEAKLHHELLWDLILRIEANFNNLERLKLLPHESISLPPIFKRFKMQRPETLEIHNLWWHNSEQDHIELEPEVCRACWPYFVGRFTADERNRNADVVNIETAYCILHDSPLVEILRTTCGHMPSPSVAHYAYSL